MAVRVFSLDYPNDVPDITPLNTGLKGPGEGIWLEYHETPGRFGTVVNYQWI